MKKTPFSSYIYRKESFYCFLLLCYTYFVRAKINAE